MPLPIIHSGNPPQKNKVPTIPFASSKTDISHLIRDKMTHYFSTLCLSIALLSTTVFAIDNTTVTPAQHSNAASPLVIATAKHSDRFPLPEKSRAFGSTHRIVNCIPDGATGLKKACQRSVALASAIEIKNASASCLSCAPSRYT